MIIYKITNLINGKSYIGQSVNSFNRRYDCGKWWVYTGNVALKRAAKRYGHESFEVSFLESDVSTQEELNRLEIYWIKALNTVQPNGYNFIEGGKTKKHHPDTADKISRVLRKGKPFEFKSPDGKIVKVSNLTKFCRENGLQDSLMNLVANGKRNQHKGWKNPSFDTKPRKIVSPEGKVFVIQDRELRDFCRQHNLHKAGLLRVWQGKYSQHKGWTKYNE